jgi:hypothetical protein
VGVAFHRCQTRRTGRRELAGGRTSGPAQLPRRRAHKPGVLTPAGFFSARLSLVWCNGVGPGGKRIGGPPALARSGFLNSLGFSAGLDFANPGCTLPPQKENRWLVRTLGDAKSSALDASGAARRCSVARCRAPSALRLPPMSSDEAIRLRCAPDFTSHFLIFAAFDIQSIIVDGAFYAILTSLTTRVDKACGVVGVRGRATV